MPPIRPGAGSSPTASRTGAANGISSAGTPTAPTGALSGSTECRCARQTADDSPIARPPDGDVVVYLRRTMGFAMWPYRSVMRVHARAEDLTGRVEGLITPIDEHTCRLEMGSDSYALVALVVGMLDVEFEVESPPELATHLQTLANRFIHATGKAQNSR